MQTSVLIPVMWVSLVATSAIPPVDRQQHHPCRDDIIAVCLSSAFHTTKAALPTMLERKWGRIINTGVRSCTTASAAADRRRYQDREEFVLRLADTRGMCTAGSMHSLVASPYKSAYNAAKHGVSSCCGAHCRHSLV